jgi:hypothetical protein
MAKLVKRWQEQVTKEEDAAYWNELALPYAISGYNVYTKWGALSSISVPPTANGSGSVDVTVTYTCGLPVSKAMLFIYDGDTWTDKTPAGGLEAGVGKTTNVTIDTSGTYYFFLAHKDINDIDLGYEEFASITKWTPRTTEGAAVEAKCVVTVS